MSDDFELKNKINNNNNKISYLKQLSKICKSMYSPPFFTQKKE